uniref:Phospholipase A2 inhibitor and Ly6/PLAUR domain-containing protein-like n=1 Tax=Leptobrachium leishanense TaxID=445787 RepID=A0A8C5QWN2_9ANUR
MKSSLLGFLYVLLAMLTTVHSLVCEICHSTDVTWCTGSSVICPSGQVCGSQFSTTTIGEETHTTFVRSCVQPAECFLKGSVTFNKGSMKMCTSCCNTNNCFATLPDFPEDSTEANGVICRTCATLASTWCYTSDIMHCTGLETKCLRQSVEVVGSVPSVLAIRGCASKTVCDLGYKTSSSNGQTIAINSVCTSGSGTLRYSLILPVILCSALTKFLS